jgi:hypothetical protein
MKVYLKGALVMINTNKKQEAIKIQLRPKTSAKQLCRDLLCSIGDPDQEEAGNLNTLTRRLIKYLRSIGVKELRLNKYQRCYDDMMNSQETEDFLKFIATSCDLKILISMPLRYRKQLESNEQFVRMIHYV